MKKVDYQFQVTFWNESNDLCKTINIFTEYPNKVDVCNYIESNYPNLLKAYGGEFDYYEINKIKSKFMPDLVKISEETIIRFYDIDVDGDGEDITIDDIETTLGELGWSEEQTPADLIEEIGADYISDECGWCVNGYNWEIVK